ncbi:MAG: LysR family transcriptional regulator [Cyanobacteria bacterium P01_D01_bin.36]
MNLSSIDLNLLVVFQALMTHRHVTRAGEALGLSQPATSNALARLRKLTNDELFIRGARGVQPTPKARSLSTQLQPALSQIQNAFTVPETFDPASSDMTFTIGMSDYVEFTLLPPLLKHLQQVAPGISLQIRSGDRTTQLAMLDSGELDLICGLFPEQVDQHKQQKLFSEKFVAVCRVDHPDINNKLSLKAFVKAHHLLVSVKEDRTGRIDLLLAKQNLQRHIAVSVPHFLVAPGIVAQSDLITTMTERVAKAFAQPYHLQLLPLPLAVTGFSVFMRWHKSNETVAAQQWLRSTLAAISQCDLSLDPSE